MTDKEFWDTFIIERMQMHMTKAHPRLTEDELAAALELEAKYNLVLLEKKPGTITALPFSLRFRQ